MSNLTKSGHPRKRAVGAGRKPALIRKVRLTVNILPTTRKWLGSKPGAMLDGLANLQTSGVQSAASSSSPLRAN